jgi:hypothetical protein
VEQEPAGKAEPTGGGSVVTFEHGDVL